MSPLLTGAQIAGFLPEGLLDSTWNVLIVILGVGLLILVHELGHFAVAKWCDVKVEAFSLGFGPFLGFKRGETEYRLSLIPLGGYVKMVGEGLPIPGETYDPRDLRSKSGLARTAIFSAGVVMNAITGMILFAVVFAVGVDLPPPVVGAVEPGSSAWEAGLEPGDRIVDIDGHTPIDFVDMASEMAYSEEGTDIHVRYERDGETHDVVLQTARGTRYPVPTVGIALDASGRPLTRVIRVVSGGAADAAGLVTGDRMVAVAGQRSDSPYDLRILLAGQTARTMVTVVRDGEERTFEFEPRAVDSRPLIGLNPYDGEIVAVREGSPAATAGLRAGDRFLRVANEETPTSTSWARALQAITPSDDEVPVTMLRDDVEVVVPVRFRTIRERTRLLASIDAVADDARFRYVGPEILPENPVRQAGIPEGSLITAVNGKSVKTWNDALVAIREVGEEPIRLTWRGEDGAESTSGPIERVASRHFDSGVVWIVAKERVREDVGTAIVVGFQRSVLMAKRVFQTIAGIFRGSISGKALGGPVMIFRTAQSYAEQSLGELIMFLGLLSVNLAIINLLPIPILDGGHLVFLLIEKVKGSPVRERTFGLAQWAGLVLILALLVYVTFNDILRLV